MFCNRCGKAIADDAVVCVACGRAVKPIVAAGRMKKIIWISSIIYFFGFSFTLVANARYYQKFLKSMGFPSEVTALHSCLPKKAVFDSLIWPITLPKLLNL